MNNQFKTILIELPDDLEQAAARAALRAGVSLTDFMTEAITEKIAVASPQPVPRHRCFIYEGSPSRKLPLLAAVICKKMEENYRCLFLHNSKMVAGMEAELKARGHNVIEDTKRGKLVLSSDQQGPIAGRFDVDGMLRGLEDSLQQALHDGCKGLWASGDMTWEFGRARDLSQLLEYEERLEDLFHKHPQLQGLCQYHRDTLPPEAVEQGRTAHPSIFVNETLSYPNPHYRPRGPSATQRAM